MDRILNHKGLWAVIIVKRAEELRLLKSLGSAILILEIGELNQEVTGNLMKKEAIVVFVDRSSLSLKGNITVENVECNLYYNLLFKIGLYVDHAVQITGTYQGTTTRK